MNIQNVLIQGFSFNRNALGGGPTRSGVFRRGGGVHIKSHFISEINYCRSTRVQSLVCHGR